MIKKIDTKTISKTLNPVENYDGVLGYICGDVNRSIKLTTYLKDELTQIFGSHNTRFRGEFYYYVWIVEFNNETFNIFTANGKGTRINIEGKYYDDKSKVCMEFLKEIERLLDNLNNN